MSRDSARVADQEARWDLVDAVGWVELNTVGRSKRAMRTATLSLALAWYTIILGFVVGCGANKVYRVSSDPPGATVSSGNVTYGTTPFTTDLNTVLPHRAYDAKISASRKLTFSKDGYLPGTAVISEFGKARDVHVVLHRQEGGSGGEGEEPLRRSIESRLTEAKRLRDQGLITEEEYRAKKEEILSGL